MSMFSSVVLGLFMVCSTVLSTIMFLVFQCFVHVCLLLDF